MPASVPRCIPLAFMSLSGTGIDEWPLCDNDTILQMDSDDDGGGEGGGGSGGGDGGVCVLVEAKG